MDLPTEITWSDTVKKRINGAVLEEVGRVRISQKVLPTRHFTNSPLDVLVDALDLPHIRIREGITSPFVEIYLEFPVTAAQVRNEAESMICQTLSRMAAKSIALAEDMIIFRGRDARNDLPAGVQADQLDAAHHGLLGAAAPSTVGDANPNQVGVPIDVNPPPNPRPGLIYGENVFAAVAAGIAKLVSKGQAPDYALFLPTGVYADTFVPPGPQSLVTTADRIRPMLEGGFHGTGVLPPDRGLLVALGGQPAVIYMGREAEIEYVRKEGAQHFFRVTERVQFVARDPRALVLLKFNQPARAQ
jgi:uncharacterized linocin/CFP29 family protein